MIRPIVELCEHGQAKKHYIALPPSRDPADIGWCPGGRVLEDMLDALALIATSWEGEKCNQCGKPYADVYSLPDELWARIHERAPAGLLCPVCALERVGRVLQQAIIIEKNANGEWPDWVVMELGGWNCPDRIETGKGPRDLLDALASAQEKQ